VTTLAHKPGSEEVQTRVPRRGHARQFWKRITEGFELQQLWRQFVDEARDSYGHYSRDIDWNAIGEQKRWKRPLRIARAIFMAMLMKLTPARRVIFLLACILLVMNSGIHLIDSRSTQVVITTGGIGAVLLIVLLALELADRITMKRDLEIARDIQRWLVPENPPQISGIDIAFAYRPANTVAGDYYDAFLLPGPAGDRQRLFFVAADVAGKGVPAALLMATFQASLRTLSESGATLPEIVAGLNRYACSHSLDGRRFTTAFFGELCLDNLKLIYINAGHNSPILRQATGRIETLSAGGLPLGIPQIGANPAQYEVGSTSLSTGDVLIVFTDGLVEAFNAREEEYGDVRLSARVQQLPRVPAAAILQTLMADVDGFVGQTRQHDDITCVVMKIVGS
jgi:phosphoserine phosphatase RsbU/P